MLVIDASVLAALLMPENGGEEVEKAVKEAERVSTLDLAAYEVGNAVWRRTHLNSPWRPASRCTAAYVVLAKRLDARLLTLDGELLRKFPTITYAPL